jgi:hypothetical protein
MRYPGTACVACLICFYSYSVAQTGAASFTSSLSAGIKGHYGFFMVNQPKAEYVRDSHTYFGELCIGHQTDGSHAWQRVNYNPQVGLSILYGNTGSREFIGNMAAVFPWIRIPLLKGRHASTAFRLGFGAGWVQKPYDKENNTKNLIIGTHINGCISMLLEQEWRLQKHLFLSTGVSFTHLSNGSIVLPNLGLNIPALSLGMRYAVQGAAANNTRQPLPPMPLQWHYYALSFAAGKQSYPLQSPVYLVNTLLLEALKDYSHNGRFGGGLNITYDRSLSKEKEQVYEFERNDPFWQISVYGAYERVIGKLSIPVQLGMYLYNKYQFNAMYQVMGLRYRFWPHWMAGVQLKTHMGKADYIQWGIGYKL